jgi:ParB-like nuclease domain
VTSLERLKKYDLQVVPPATPGNPPRMEWINISSLRIDPSYQRPIVGRGLATIRKIVTHFEWARFSPLIVAPVPGAKAFTVIDGQHRATAALICGYDRVPCSIVDVAADQAARIFAAVNGTVTPMSILSLFKAARIAGEPWALSVDRACAAAGIEPLTSPVSRANMKPKQTLAIGTVRKMIERFGEDVVAAALVAENGNPLAAEPGHYNSTTISSAVERFRARKPEREPPRVEGRADRIRALKGRGYSRQAIAVSLGVSYAEIEEALR